jgi:DNA-binding MarR family transcriptional regulator
LTFKKYVATLNVATYKNSSATNLMQMAALSNEIQRKSGFDSLEEETLLSLMLTYKHLKGELDRFFKKHGTSGPQYESLRIIDEHGNSGIPVRKIAALMVTEQPDITRIIDRLEASRLVERVRGKEDRRVVFVRITNKGKGFIEKLRKTVTKLHQTQFTPLKKNELKLLNRLLDQSRLPK